MGFDLDVDLYVLGITRTLNADGSKSAVLEVSNVAMKPVNSATTLADSTAKLGYHATTVGSLWGAGGGIVAGKTLPYLTIYLADDEIFELAVEANVGLLTVICIEDGSVATFSITGVNHVAYEINDPQEQYTATAGTDGMTNLYSGTASPYYYEIENKRGDDRTYCVYTYLGMTE